MRVPAREPDEKLVFLRAFLQRPKQIGSVIPSSRFLVRRLMRAARPEDAKLVVEYGPGTGVVTRELLRRLPSDGRLLAIEINERLAEHLREQVADPRLVVHVGSAADLPAILAARGLGAPDVVVSGIPFSTMDLELGRRILGATHRALAPRGRFVAYQVRDRVESLGRELMGRAETKVELRNLPPMRIYSWTRPEEARG